jgi:hypothetical protein
MMKFFIRFFCSFVFFHFLFFYLVNSKIYFGGDNSEFNIYGASRLVSTNNVSVIKGTVNLSNPSNLSTGDLLLAGGFLNLAGTEVKMTGEFGAGTGQVRLHGNHSIQIEPGTLLGDVDVKGTGNKIEGAPVFSYDIDFYLSSLVSTDLTLALQSVLNKNVNLNGGSLLLKDDLHLANNVVIAGDSSLGSDGVIKSNIVFNGNKIVLGYLYDENKWNTALNFKSSNIECNGNISLGISALWYFTGTHCFVNGKGIKIDLSNGGKIKIGANTTLHLHDVYLKGISNNFISFESGAKLILTSSMLDFSGSTEFTSGTTQIESPSTFVLRSKNVTFKDSAKLVVNDRLSLDIYDNEDESGGLLKIGDEFLFVNHSWNNDISLSGDNFSTRSKELIREVSDTSLSVIHFFDSPVTQDVTLDKPIFIVPERRIKIANNVTLDGQGTTIEFSRLGYYESGVKKGAQFVVDSGKTVTLKNICLSGITNNTFDIAGTVKIGENVIFELADDALLSKGSIILDGSETVFVMRGFAGKKKMIFTSNLGFNLGKSSLLLQNIELIDNQGSHITYTDGTLSSIALGGNSTFDVYSANSNLNFNIEDIGNKLVFFGNNLTYSKSIVFDGISAINELSMYVAGADSTITAAEDGSIVSSGNVTLNLSGDPGIYLIGDGNVSVLEFLNYDITVNNKNSNAFYIDDGNDGGAVLIGNTVRTDPSGFDIKKVGTNTSVDLKYAFADFDSSFTRSFKVPLTTFGKMRKGERQRLQNTFDFRRKKTSEKVKLHDISKKQQKGKKKTKRSRGLDLPSFVDQEVGSGNALILQKSLRSNINVNKGGVLENFYTHQKDETSMPFCLTIKDAEVKQSKNNSVKLEDNQVINVVGCSKINVSGRFEINKNFHVDDGAYVTFSNLALSEGAEKNNMIPTVVIAPNTKFVIPKSATVKFENVNLVLSNKSKIVFHTNDVVDSVVSLFKNDRSSADFAISKDDFTIKKKIGKLELSGFSSLSVANFRQELIENRASIEGVGRIDVLGGSSIIVPFPEVGEANKNILNIAPNQEDRLVFHFNSGFLQVGKESIVLQETPSIVENSEKGLAQVLTGLGETAWYFGDNSSLKILSTGFFGFNVKGVEVSGQLRSSLSRMLTRGNVAEVLQFLDDGIISENEMDSIIDLVGTGSVGEESSLNIDSDQAIKVAPNSGYVAAFFGNFSISSNGILCCGENTSSKTFPCQVGLERIIGEGIIVYLGSNSSTGKIQREFSVASVYKNFNMTAFNYLFSQGQF